MSHIDNIREIERNSKRRKSMKFNDLSLYALCVGERKGYLGALKEFKRQFDDPEVLIQTTRDDVDEAIKEAEK